MALPLSIKPVTEPIELHISKDNDEPFPVAILSITDISERYRLHLNNPRPLSELTKLFGECYEIVITDVNAIQGNQLEFGRYRLEIWDEDNPIGTVIVDSYQLLS